MSDDLPQLTASTEVQIERANACGRTPVVFIREKGHTVPWAIANASYKQQKDNPGVTEIVEMPNRGHSLTIDNGWREVATAALDFVSRYVK